MKFIGWTGFVLTVVGMSALDSQGTANNIACIMTALGLLFLFCWSSKGGRRR